MNAVTPTLTQAVIDNEPLLRRIAAAPGGSHIDAAKAVDKRPDNVGVTLRNWLAAGLVDDAKFPTLTDAGRRALSALDVAAGRAQVGDASDAVALRHDQLVADPDNARTASGLDEDSLADLADTLARETMLQPPRVRLVDADTGLHMLVYGERRWRAWGLLIAQGRWPADKTIPCKLATGDKAQADIVALIENLQRADIDNLEAGESFVRVARAHNMSPQTIAARIGKDPRYVQIAMQVAQEATPEDKAAYRASQAAYAAAKTRRTFTWTKLRESVRDHEDRPPLVLDPKAAAALGEIWLRSGGILAAGENFTPLVRDIVDGPITALTTAGLAKFAWRDGVKGLALIPTSELHAWLEFHGLDTSEDAVVADAVMRLQAAVVGDMMAAKLRADGLFVTLAFNQPDPAPPLHEPSPRPSASAEPGPSPSAPSDETALRIAPAPERDEPPPPDSAEPQPDPAPTREPGDDFARQIRAANAEAAAEARIPPMQRLILIELRHALINTSADDIKTTMTGDVGVDFGGEFWSDTAAQALIAAGLIVTLQGADGAHLALLTDPGDEAVAALLGGHDPTPADLDKARRDAHWPREDGAAYSTAWLNPPRPAPGDETNAVRAPFPMPFRIVALHLGGQGEADCQEFGCVDEGASRQLAEILVDTGAAFGSQVLNADGDLVCAFGAMIEEPA